MPGHTHSRRSRIGAVAIVALVASMAATVSYADNAQQIGIAKGSRAAHETAHATYPSGSAGSKRDGGYSWTQRSFSTHRTSNQMMLPMPCR